MRYEIISSSPLRTTKDQLQRMKRMKIHQECYKKEKQIEIKFPKTSLKLLSSLKRAYY